MKHALRKLRSGLWAVALIGALAIPAMAFDCRSDTVYIDYGPATETTGGIWKYERGDFQRITTSDPENILAVEQGLLGDFGSAGTWLYDGDGWKRISEANPQQMVK